MADGRGGYQRPSNPAPVSGPGKLSRRTDGQPIADLADAGYGENKEYRELQAAAPMARAGTPSSAGTDAMSRVIGLGEPSLQPDVPVTAGAEYGAGPGVEALGLDDLDQMDADEFDALKPMLIRRAMRDDTPRSVKTLIRRLISR
jgi:hypothetical protein